jgi:tetratricopeptide (TPR) repeat protein
MVLNSLGGARRDQGNLDEAITDFKRSLEIKTSLGDQRGIAMVLNCLGGARRDQGDLDGAIADFKSSLEIEKSLGDQRGIAMVLNSLGGARRDQGDLSGAIADFEHSLEIRKSLGDQRGIAMVFNSLGGARRDQGNIDGVIADLERSLEIRQTLGDQRQIAMVLSSLGGALCIKGEIDRALETYDRLRDLRNADGQPLPLKNIAAGVKGRCYKLRKWKKSLEACNTEKEQRHTVGQYHLEMGRTSFAADIDLSAYWHLKRAFSFDLDSKEQAECWFHLGRACARLDRPHEAVRAFRCSLDLAAEGGTVLYGSLGHALYEIGAPFEEIQEAFERAIEADSDNAWAHSWYALALKDKGQIEEAEGHAQLAVDLKPDNPVLLTNLGQVLMTYDCLPKLRDAVSAFERAQLKAEADFRWPSIHLATVRKRLEEIE